MSPCGCRVLGRIPTPKTEHPGPAHPFSEAPPHSTMPHCHCSQAHFPLAASGGWGVGGDEALGWVWVQAEAVGWDQGVPGGRSGQELGFIRFKPCLELGHY